MFILCQIRFQRDKYIHNKYLLNRITIYFSTSSNKLFVLNYGSFCLTIGNFYCKKIFLL